MISFSEKIEVYKATEGTYKLGVYVKQPNQRTEMFACVQPFFPKEHLKETSGRRTTDAIKIYTKDQLSSQPQADIVIWNNKKYEVYQVDNHQYSKFNLSHYKAIALLVDEDKQ